MDTRESVEPLPYGPIRVPRNRQIALPKDLVDQIGLATDDLVYVTVSKERAGSLLVTPPVR
jgi:hypothetical protein